jgi:glycosyl hydrolase family 76
VESRALATYAAMQQALYASRQTGLYRETAPVSGGNAFAYVWPHSRAVVGTLALAGTGGSDLRPDVKDRLDALAWYWDGRAYASYVMPPYGNGGDRYSDDNTWIALALVQSQRMGLLNSQRRAQDVMKYLLTAWDKRDGGLYWVQQGAGFGLTNHDRGAGATAGAAELAFHLGLHDDGLRMLDWVNRSVDRSDTGVGPFLNAVRADGSVDRNLWSYNQGVMIGGHVAAYHALGDVRSVHTAEGIAGQTFSTFGNFTGQPPSFNAMCFQNLLMLHAVTQDTALQTRILEAMRTYADWTWDPATGARDPSTNLFYFTDAGQPALGRQAARLQDQAAMLQLYALLDWNPSDYSVLT